MAETAALHFNHFNQIFLCNDTASEVNKDLRSVSLIKSLASGYSCIGSWFLNHLKTISAENQSDHHTKEHQC